jgi:hypothetical protein
VLGEVAVLGPAAIMGKVERLMIEAMLRHVESHGRGMTPEEALAAIVPADQPKLRHRPAYKHCFDRLNRRHYLDPEWPATGEVRFRPSDIALEAMRGG